MDRIEKLKEAAALIEEVQSDLNIHYYECKSCGHKVYENWSEYQANDQLKAALDRINKWADAFERGDPCD
jgi:hypothetical protein